MGSEIGKMVGKSYKGISLYSLAEIE